MPREEKADKTEYARRLAIVQQLLIKGFTSREITLYARDNWNLSVASSKIYIKKATDGFKDYIKGDVEAELNTAIERRLNLYRKMEKNADNPKAADVALKVLQDIARLKGQYIETNLTKHQLLDKDGNPTDIQKTPDPLAPIEFTVNVIKKDADDIQRTTTEGILEQEASNT